MSGQHTPGPWYADKLQDRNAFNVFPCGATHALLTVAAPVHDGAHPYGQAAGANARLIAAAPDMLEALRQAKNSLIAFKLVPGPSNTWEAHDEANLRTVNEAITRATGGAA